MNFSDLKQNKKPLSKAAIARKAEYDSQRQAELAAEREAYILEKAPIIAQGILSGDSEMDASLVTLYSIDIAEDIFRRVRE